MKKLLAFMFAAVLVVSFTGCTKTLDKVSKDTTEDTTVATDNNLPYASGDEIIADNTSLIEGSTSAPLTPVPATVQEWVEQNQDVMQAYCEEFGYNVEVIDDAIIISNVMEEPTQELIDKVNESFAAETERWGKLTDKEKADEMSAFAKDFEGKTEMPVPETVIRSIYDNEGELIVSFTYTL